MPLPLLHSAVRSPNHSDLAQCSLEITSHYQIAAAAAAAVVRRRHSWSWAQSRQPGTLSCDSIPSNPVEDCHARSWQCQCAQWTTCRRNCHFLFAHIHHGKEKKWGERESEGRRRIQGISLHFTPLEARYQGCANLSLSESCCCIL